jgi:hypothetical protein
MRGKSYFFLSAAALGAVAVFVFTVANANAYAVQSTGQPLGGQPSQAPMPTGVNSNYNFGGSFQNLISPFQNFFNSLQWNGSTTFQISPTSTMLPPITVSPSLQNTLTDPFTQFDNWFYGLTGVRLSGIVVAILSIISWALGLVLAVVNWLLGLFH